MNDKPLDARYLASGGAAAVVDSVAMFSFGTDLAKDNFADQHEPGRN